jgi:ATP:ADP antiporter, AAA family
MLKFLSPDLPHSERTKFAFLTLIFFLIVGSYWFIGLLKDTVFLKIAFPTALGWSESYGRLMLPTAKFWTPFIIVFIVLIYSKFVDLVRRHQLFYIFGIFFMIIFAFVGTILYLRAINGNEFVGKNILAFTGWLSFFATESFGSLMTAMFWSFVISITDTDTAKLGFPLIVSGAQIGSITGSACTILANKLGGVWPLYFVGCFFIFLILLSVKYFVKKYPVTPTVTPKKDLGFAGVIEGIKLLVTTPYLLGIFVVSTFYGVAIAVIDYQMRVQADLSTYFQGEIGFSLFQTIYGVAANTCALIVALFATKYILKHFGIRFSLLIFPIYFAITLSALLIYVYLGSFSANVLLWSTFAILVTAKGLTYGLNNPTKEILYIPTSKDVQYKTKGFTDTFGQRAALMTGASISNQFKENIFKLMSIGTLICLGFVGIWALVAIFVGKKNRELRD